MPRTYNPRIPTDAEHPGAAPFVIPAQAGIQFLESGAERAASLPPEGERNPPEGE